MIKDRIEEFCCEFFGILGLIVYFLILVVFVEVFFKFVDINVLVLVKLIEDVIGIVSECRDLLKIVNVVSKVFCFYVYYEWGVILLDMKNILVVDCIVVFCVICY